MMGAPPHLSLHPLGTSMASKRTGLGSNGKQLAAKERRRKSICNAIANTLPSWRPWQRSRSSSSALAWIGFMGQDRRQPVCHFM
jgi:hypothetical protein